MPSLLYGRGTNGLPFEVKGVSVNVACINQNVEQCIPTQNNTDPSANDQNMQTKNSPKRKGADEEQALKMKRAQNDNDRNKIAKEVAKNRKKTKLMLTV